MFLHIMQNAFKENMVEFICFKNIFYVVRKIIHITINEKRKSNI